MAITVTTVVHSNGEPLSTETYETGVDAKTSNGELHIRRHGGDVIGVYAPGAWLSAHEDGSMEGKYV